jgi:hypothetical protein
MNTLRNFHPLLKLIETFDEFRYLAHKPEPVLKRIETGANFHVDYNDIRCLSWYISTSGFS